MKTTRKEQFAVYVLAALMAIFIYLDGQEAKAGTLYFSRAAYTAALPVPTTHTEDFDAFPIGPVASPLVIMGGLMEVGGTTLFIDVFTNTVTPATSGSNALDMDLSTPTTQVLMTGLGGTDLGFSAFGLDFAHELSSVTFDFETEGGANNVIIFAQVGFPEIDEFIGWIGGPNQVLAGVTVSEALRQGGPITLDNIVASDPIPAPATIALLGLGYVGLAGGAVRKRWKKKAVDKG